MINNKETEDVNHFFEPKEDILALNRKFLIENAKTCSFFTTDFSTFHSNFVGPNEPKSFQNESFKEELFKDLNEILKNYQDSVKLWKKE